MMLQNSKSVVCPHYEVLHLDNEEKKMANILVNFFQVSVANWAGNDFGKSLRLNVVLTRNKLEKLFLFLFFFLFFFFFSTPSFRW